MKRKTNKGIRNRKKWIKALRSGEYKKTKKCGWPRYKDHYTCFGVLCDVSGKGKWDRGSFIIPGYYPDTSEEKIVQWAGLHRSNTDHIINSLNFINSRFNFNQVADIIENDWELLIDRKRPTLADYLGEKKRLIEGASFLMEKIDEHVVTLENLKGRHNDFLSRSESPLTKSIHDLNESINKMHKFLGTLKKD